MFFFIALFLLLVIVFLNIYAKRDPVSKDKISHSVEFDRELAEPGEDFFIVTKVENFSSHSMGRVYITAAIDEGIEIKNKKYKVKYSKSQKTVVCKTSIRSRRSRELQIAASVEKRGAYWIKSFQLDCLDALGFHISYYNKPVNKKIVIAPKRVNHDFISKMVVPGYGDENAKHGFIEDETAIRTYGEYTGHEPMRHINWKKSAQVGEFVVKQFEPMGTNVNTVVFDIGGCVNSKANTLNNDLFEYAVSMLREVLEYFEAKRIKYRVITNAKSSMLRELTFSSVPSGKKTRNKMLYMLGELDCEVGKSKYYSSRELLSFAIKSSYNAPFAYLSTASRTGITLSLRKLMKIKGIDIIELYAQDYYTPQQGETENVNKA